LFPEAGVVRSVPVVCSSSVFISCGELVSFKYCIGIYFDCNDFSMTTEKKRNLMLCHRKCNMEMVELLPLELEEDINYVEGLLKEFQEKTGSLIAEDLMKTWPAPVSRFVKVQ
jgi:hypothetical protein